MLSKFTFLTLILTTILGDESNLKDGDSFSRIPISEDKKSNSILRGDFDELFII